MKVRRIISIAVACAAAIGSLGLTAFAADDRWKPKNEDPFIFVHGLNGWGEAEGVNKILPYWGADSGDLMKYLRSEGYECYATSTGPMNSAWDEACELYAQLMGTTVDYGVAHSGKFHHKRFGRTYYRPLVPDWGEIDGSGELGRVHLIGHSFGGTTIRVLVQLLTEGSAEERAATPSNDISGLFTGGKGKWVKSVATICTPHNSSSAYYPLVALGLDKTIQFFSYLYAGIAGRSFLNGLLVDFHFEQFGLTEIPGEGKADNLFKALKLALDNKEDSCQYDAGPEGNAKLNEKLSINKDIYYFSYAFSTTREIPVLGVQVPSIRTNPIIAPLAAFMGFMEFKDPYTGIVYDEDWLASDALVNTESAKYPVDEPHKDFDPNDVRPGIWNVMPVMRGDHGTAIGLLAGRERTRGFYLGLCEALNGLPD